MSKLYTYTILTRDFGEIRKADTDIKAARLWAKRAFTPGQVLSVSRESMYNFCDACQCTPCCCMVRRDA